MPSPVEIKVALHYFYSPIDYTAEHNDSESVKGTIERLVSEGLLTDRHVGNPKAVLPRYVKTEGLNMYVERLCSVPRPRQITRWEIPD